MVKVAVVTGAGSGIGLSVTKRLLDEDFHVLAIDKNKESLQDMERVSNNQKLTIKACDVTNKSEVQMLIDHFGGQMGHINVLFAGVGHMVIGGFADLQEDDWDHSFMMNIKTIIYCIEAALVYLKNTDNSNIITLSSILSETNEHSALAYTTTKAMLISFTKAMSKDLVKYGVRVNCISPGPIQTQFSNQLIKDAKQKQGGKELLMRLSTTPLRRMGSKEEIADTVSYIISNKFMTGSIIKIDGGWSL